MPTTPVFGWRYQARGDQPHGPNLGENLALDIEATLAPLVGPWQAWAPTYNNLTIGNGVVTARRRIVDKTMDFYWTLTVGSTTVFSGIVSIGLDATVAAYITSELFGTVWAFDTSSGARRTGALNGAGVTPFTLAPDGSALTAVSAASPWTWATGDKLNIWGSGIELA